MSGSGNEAMVRAVADQVADAAVERYAQRHPAPEPKMEVPAPLKWAAAIVAAIMAAGGVALVFWIVGTLSDLQQTVTRIDERQQLTGGSTTQRIDKIEERVTRLEQAKQEARP